MQTTLEQLLKSRFDTVAKEVLTALSECTLDQLKNLVNPAIDAHSLDNFLSHISKPKEGDKESENTGENMGTMNDEETG